MTFGAAVLLFGLFLTIASQIAIAMHAFAANPLKGLGCLFLPLYVFVYARKQPTSRRFMAAWYIGVALWIVGGVMVS